MKNYVIWTNCKISETEEKFGIKPCGDPASQAAYDTMFRVSQATVKKFLAGDWESVVFTEPSETRVDMFQANWQRIWNIWHQEPCNILYLDSDAMMVRPTEIFGRFAEFRLFNWSDPKQNEQFDNYFNAGVRYYPHSMTDEIWQTGQAMSANWNLDIWDQEQLIFNEMFWRQSIPGSDRRHPELNWQGMQMITGIKGMQKALEDWNGLPASKAHILHVHGSRSPTHTAQLMINTARQVGIEI